MRKQSVKYQKVDLPGIEEDEEYQQQTHPLDSTRYWLKFVHYVFQIWVFGLISTCQKATLNINDIPALPKYLTVAEAYKNWTEIYQDRKSKKLSVTTLSMIFQTQKKRILFVWILYGLHIFGTFYISFLIVRYNFSPIMTKIVFNAEFNTESENRKLIWDVSKYAVLLFLVAVIGCTCKSCGYYFVTEIMTQVVGCIQFSLFKKLLSIDLSAPDKQQLLNIVGAEVSMLSNQLHPLFNMPCWLFYYLIAFEILLYKSVGISSVFGILFMIFIGLPVQLFVGLKYAKKQKERLHYSAKRVQLITQLISGIRYLKNTVSEMALMKRINEYRANELKSAKETNFYISMVFVLNLSIPALTIFIVLMAYMFVFDKEVTTLTILSLVMNVLLAQAISRVLPVAFAALGLVSSSTQRIDEFLNKAEKTINIDHGPSEELTQSDDKICQINNAFFKWNTAEEKTDKDSFMLKNVCLSIDRGKLIAIIGTVGSGKTSLIQSILGEMNCTKGNINVNVNKYGYCAQCPYIQNATFRDNIIMDLEFDEQRYKQCIYAADLVSDLKQLPLGDLTNIGSEGINISGGQKMRLCFARTLYRKDEYDLFLFDDPLSSVDIYVGKHMFFHGIKNYLELKQNNKTCLMTINSHLYLLKYFDEIIVIENGEVKLHTPTSKLLDESNKLYRKYSHLLPQTIDINNGEKRNGIQARNEMDIDINIERKDNLDNNYLYFDEQSQLMLPDMSVYKEILRYSLMKVDYEKAYYDDSDTKVKYSNCKLAVMMLVFLILFVCSCGLILCDVWLVIWRENVDVVPTTNFKFMEITDKSTSWYFGIWFALLAFIVFMTLTLLNYINAILVKASDSVFTKTLLNILKCNTLFFDLIPRGQLLNVLSSDPNSVDTDFPIYAILGLMLLGSVIGYFLMITITNPSILLFIVFFVAPISLFMAKRIRKSYYSSSVLWKLSLSPILSLFDESINGLDSIRAYKFEEHFSAVIKQRIDNCSKCKYSSRAVISWSELYLGIFCNFCVSIAAIYFGLKLLYFNSDQSDPNFMILSIWWYSCLNTNIMGLILLKTESDTHISSIQKMFFYCDSDTNIDAIYKSKRQKIAKFENDTKWPFNGDLTIQKLALKYRQHFDIVLDINKEIQIKQGTKLAICGRTGSGKSSILVSIFRLFEPCMDSNVMIDESNIYKLGLYDVRSNLSIIMQTPILFAGTLRFNLDPFTEYCDNEIWTALKDVQLFELIKSRENGLYCDVGENGSRFSVGEAQLICFARAMLKKTKILFMDEPTSSIDKQTDKVIQNLIRSEKFEETTIICIAHRLQTILDYEYIMVLEKGKVLEYDTPRKLIKNKQSKFYNLLRVSELYYK